MEKKLVVVALGAFGFGALVSWAITADLAENRLIAERESFDEIIRKKTNHIWVLQDRIEHDWAIKNKKDEPETDPNQTELIDVKQWGVEAPIKTLETPYMEALVTEDEEEPNVDSITGVVPEGETPEETKSNLQSLIDAYTSKQDQNKEFEAIVENTNEYDNAPPFVISRNNYAWDEEGENYDKITLTYYPRDRVLLDDEEDPIEDITRIIGWKNLNRFGSESEDPDVVFVRNRRMATDFEVIKEESQLPLHVKYGMEKEEFRANRAAGLIKLRQEDDDN